MRKNIVFSSLVIFLVILASISMASAEITLTKPTETIMVSNLDELLKPEVLKIIALPDGGYSAQFAYENYLFEGIIPGVLSFGTAVVRNYGTNGLTEEIAYSIIIFEKYMLAAGNCPTLSYCSPVVVQIRFRLSSAYAYTRDELVRFFTPQTIKGIVNTQLMYKNGCCEQILDIVIYPR